MVTKSGSDRLHGNLFEFFRNTNLDARNYFSPERAEFEQNQPGGTVGGPIKKGKIFFFGDYQATRTTQGIETGNIPVPSLAERAGDLSGIADQLTGNVNGSYWAGVLAQRLGYPVSAGRTVLPARLLDRSTVCLSQRVRPELAHFRRRRASSSSTCPRRTPAPARSPPARSRKPSATTRGRSASMATRVSG